MPRSPPPESDSEENSSSEEEKDKKEENSDENPEESEEESEEEDDEEEEDEDEPDPTEIAALSEEDFSGSDEEKEEEFTASMLSDIIREEKSKKKSAVKGDEKSLLKSRGRSLLIRAFEYMPRRKDCQLIFDKKGRMYIDLKSDYERSGEEKDYKPKTHNKFYYCDQTSEFISFCDFLKKEFSNSDSVNMEGLRIIIRDSDIDVLDYEF